MLETLGSLMTRDTALLVGRMLLVIGLGAGLLSWRETVAHIGNPDFLMPGYPSAPTHGWYHVFREACGDVAKMVALLLIFFGPATWRSPVTWWIALVLMLGYYAPFWIGKPFLPELSAPNRTASLIHLAMAIPSALALLVAWQAFQTPARAAS